MPNKKWRRHFSLGDKNKNTPLHKACQKGHVKLVNLLIDSGADVNSNGYNGQTPYFEAISHKKFEVAEILLKKEANVVQNNMYRKIKKIKT